MYRLTAGPGCQVVERVRRKAAIYGQDVDAETPHHQNGSAASSAGVADGSAPHYKVSPDNIAMLYDKWVMPLTKQVQVEYLLRRLEC